MNIQFLFKRLILPCFLFSALVLKGQKTTTPAGHSHNDYLQDKPLVAALENEMLSIEIDIILVDNQIIVSHDEEEYDINQTIEKLYLEPIQKLIKKRKGALNKQRQQVQLLIDLKTKGVDILDALHQSVLKYAVLFDRRGLDKKWSPLQIVLSGEVDKDVIIGKSKYPYFHVDGRCKDIKKKYADYEMPLISENTRSTLNG